MTSRVHLADRLLGVDVTKPAAVSVEVLDRRRLSAVLGQAVENDSGRLGSTTLAEDLVQRVMTRLWQLADRYDPSRGSVRTWVFTIARTSCIDLHRAQPPAGVEASTPGEAAIDDDIEQLLHAELIRLALDRLSPDHRQVVDLSYFAGLTQVEVAARLGVPLGTVKSRSFYALKALRLTLEELGVRP